MKILHICWGVEPNNGAANIARLIMGEQREDGHEPTLVSRPTMKQLREAGQIWCHCGWYWVIWLVAAYVAFFRKRKNLRCSTSNLQPSTSLIYWMPECCYDPVRRNFHGWKKRLVGPFERWALRRADVLVATCEMEKKWILDYVWPGSDGTMQSRVEVCDIKRFFKLDASPMVQSAEGRRGEPLHVLYLGRRHPLKGVEYLEQAVAEVNRHGERGRIELRIVSDHHGEELERDWAWCDVLCLPTLSDNFGLVVAEALERGKRVITTDGAPAWEDWEDRSRLIYLRGFRDGSDRERVELLKGALERK